MELHISNSELQVPEERLECPVCAQTFISNKSLYGHMRNHPERNWRGMKPPIPEMKCIRPSFPVSGPVELERKHSVHGYTDQVSNLLLFRGWSKTGRRTRPGKALMLIPASHRGLSESDDEDHDFSVLENRELTKENLPPKKRKMESADAGNTKCSLVTSTYPASGNNDKINANPGPESSTKGKDSRCEIPFEAHKQHMCSICHRSFKSYQALGGHKAHHNNKAQKIASVGQENEFSTLDDESMAEYAKPHKGGCGCLMLHQCPFCYRIFSKGQALGGHKRHCGRPVNENLNAGGGQVAKINHVKVFRFDLNELPPEWLDP